MIDNPAPNPGSTPEHLFFSPHLTYFSYIRLMIHYLLLQTEAPTVVPPTTPPGKAVLGLMSESNKEMYLSTNPTMYSKLLKRKPQDQNGVTSAKAHDSEPRLYS